MNPQDLLQVHAPDNNDFESHNKTVLQDFYICLVSREASLWGRKEVLNGRAKFGILGDGKELPQVAMARAFKKGDWRSGYYRDQTFMFARGLCSVEDFFAQLYADSDRDPFSKGRQMNNHFASPLIEKDGEWLNQTELYNVSADVSCTAGQMARALGISMASKKYRLLEIPNSDKFSRNGNEISHVTIGDASTSEGVFWETMNAAAVMKVPLVVSVWDDGYGISVPIEYQTVKGSISQALEGFLINGKGNGIRIYTVKGWDYAELCATYEKVCERIREDHIPVLIHVQELTQPQGHSTSGSHERYKSPERLQWEKENDCIKRMEEWIIEHAIASSEEIEEIKERAHQFVRECKESAWHAYKNNIKPFREKLKNVYNTLPEEYKTVKISQLQKELEQSPNMTFAEIIANARTLRSQLMRFGNAKTGTLNDVISEGYSVAHDRYHTQLYSDTKYAAIHVPVVPVKYDIDSKTVSGYQVLNSYFDQLFDFKSNIIAFGEDVGQIGDVNQGFAGIQDKYGDQRVFDTGIREWTIMGQAIGASMRGLRPIAEIQYLDYLAYAFSALSDDLATLRYRSGGIQRAPAIIRTRGHRLEGIWHAGSPMGMILTSMQGLYLCVPRNMTQAVGFYNTLLKSDDPGIIVECLNGYRLKEKLPANLLEFTCPLGVPEILQEGDDITLVTYGSCVRVAQKGLELLEGFNISVELIDAQTLMPFDLEGIIVESLKKTNKIVFMDEDIPGGATAYMMREVLEKWNGYQYLDAPPVTLTAAAHRTPFGSDGDYFTKPNPEDVFDTILKIMHEYRPNQFPS